MKKYWQIRNQVINKLETFKTNHLKKKKDKSIAFQAEIPNSKIDDDIDADDAENEVKDESLAKIAKMV